MPSLLFNNIEIDKHPTRINFKKIKKIDSPGKKKSTYDSIETELNMHEQKKIDELEESYKRSVILLNMMIQKQMEKNIFKKYNVNNIISDNTKKINHSNAELNNTVLVKKKFLKTT